MKTENGKLKKYKLGEICDLNLSSLKSSDRIDEILYLDTSNITENRIADLQSFSIANAPSRAQRKVRNNTIIFSTVRPNQNHFGIIKNPQSNLIVSSGFTTLDIKNPEDFDANYVYLKLTQPYVVNYLHTLAQNSVSAYPSINPDDIGNLSFYFPPLESQQKIAAVLSALDEKIALNRRMNAKLEQMAKRLYDHWFVQFDFPNADGKPYKASGGKMVWNETLKREIPAGWEVKKLGELFTTNRGVSYSTKTITGDTGIPMINLASFSPDGSYKIDGIKLYTGDYTQEKVLKPFDLVMCNTQQTAIDFSKDIIGKALLVPDIFEGDITSSHHVNTLKVHNEKLKFYLYRLFNTDYFHAYISHFASGTNIMGLDFAGVENYTAAIPSEEVLSKFADFTLDIEKKKSEIIRENKKLIALRNRLLPLLMNGQVEVE